MNIPERHEDVNAEWLTEALRSGGVIDDQEVGNFQIEPLGDEVGRTSSLVRIAVEYDEPSKVLPNSMVAKFVSRIQANRDFAGGHGLFQREIELYKTLGDAIPLNMPKLYFGLASDSSDLAIILLEAIDGVSKESLSVAGLRLTATEAKLALTEVAKMHAKWWENPTLESYDWLMEVKSDTRNLMYSRYPEAWATMRRVMEPVFTPAQLQMCDKLSSYLPTLISKFDSMPVTLRHGDFHLGNLLWDIADEPETVWFIDWQGPGVGPAILDIAWCISGDVPTSDLPRVRQDYLPEYHNALLSHGVTGYEYGNFLNDYRYGLLDAVTRIIAILANVDLAREDSVEVERMVIGRMVSAAEDADCVELIS